MTEQQIKAPMTSNRQEVREDALAYFEREEPRQTELRPLSALEQMFGYYEAA